MALTLFLVAAVLFIVAYIVYGGYQERVYELDSTRRPQPKNFMMVLTMSPLIP